jgi:hypothetical protein
MWYMAETNTLAYYTVVRIIVVKRFITVSLASSEKRLLEANEKCITMTRGEHSNLTGGLFHKTFYDRNKRCSKLECLSLSVTFRRV